MKCVVVTALVLAASAAPAHVGTKVTLAQFTHPPALLTKRVDGGLGPLSFASADASFDVAWDDFDSDPTGRYFFYYVDHLPPPGLTTDDVKKLATSIPEGAGGIWASCMCMDGAGVMCPDAGDRDCRNSFTWNTSALAAGSYWLLAIDNDPPYYLYSLSESPVRIAHGGASLPPSVLLLQPNGIGEADAHYQIKWLAAGDGPLKFDVAYGSNDYPGITDAPVSIGRDVAAVAAGDGTYTFDWDCSAAPSGHVYVEVRVTDAGGRSAYSDSLSLAVLHAAADAGARDLGVARDLSLPAPAPKGCDVGAPSPSGLETGALASLVAGALALALLWARRRAMRRIGA